MDSHLLRVVGVLEAAFPDGVDDADVLPLLIVLSEGMGEENVGITAGAFLRMHEAEAVWLVTEALSKSGNRERRARVERLRQLLVSHGWDPDED
ncbi:DUF3349 domain-containing protein [Streptomyces sp. NPDC048297]|uniref:DUF3349 domain-containing protein n=1 Tax=Streptomyces sp. NPDC048297 TaxID=3365531 RepID=UPI003715931A